MDGAEGRCIYSQWRAGGSITGKGDVPGGMLSELQLTNAERELNPIQKMAPKSQWDTLL